MVTTTKQECRPAGAHLHFLIHFPGFRCAPPWAELWAHLRCLVYRATGLISSPRGPCLFHEKESAQGFKPLAARAPVQNVHRDSDESAALALEISSSITARALR